jgi:hypothetical protein
MIYIHIDGDNVGSNIELCLMDGRIQEATEISENVTDAFAKIRSSLMNESEATVHICAGDDLIASFVPNTKSMNLLHDLKTGYFSKTGLTLSIGVGETVVYSLDNLRRAKMSGKNQIVGEMNV